MKNIEIKQMAKEIEDSVFNDVLGYLKQENDILLVVLEQPAPNNLTENDIRLMNRSLHDRLVLIKRLTIAIEKRQESRRGLLETCLAKADGTYEHK